jgi:hypothetical protein
MSLAIEGTATPVGVESKETSAAAEAAEPPKFVTEEQLGRAIASRFKAHEKTLEAKFAELTTGLVTKFEESAAKMAEASKTKEARPEPAKKAEPQSFEDSPAYVAMRKQLEELTKKQEQAIRERDAEKARSRDMGLRQKVTEALSSAGVDAARAKLAIGYLIDAAKVVGYSEDEPEAVVFRTSEGDQDLGSGLRTWLKSDEGKVFLPPRGTQGSGDRSVGASPIPSSQGITKSQVASLIGQALASGEI